MNLKPDFFDCPVGVKQGDSISAKLFSICINDLAQEIKETNIGIHLTQNSLNFDENPMFINILMYADDIILLTTNEIDLQFLQTIVENWCKKWRLEVNLTKTNVMHVRNVRCNQTNSCFCSTKDQ